MVFAFDHPHPIGVVCYPPCRFCGESPDAIGDIAFADGKPTQEFQPLKIIGVATHADYMGWCREAGGLAPCPKEGNWFYFVETD